jgi:hypothetical protein
MQVGGSGSFEMGGERRVEQAGGGAWGWWEVGKYELCAGD